LAALKQYPAQYFLEIHYCGLGAESGF